MVERLTVEVKDVALRAGADLVGVVSAETADSMPRIWVGWTIQKFSKRATEILATAKSIVVLGFHIYDEAFNVATRRDDGWEYLGYYPLLLQTRRVMLFLRERGYKAVIFPSTLPIKRLAQAAGLGSFGKNSLIINPEFGPWIFLSAVLTDAQLKPDPPFEEDLCGDCERCIEACPTGALTPYKVDDLKCLVGISLGRLKSPKYAELFRRYRGLFERYEPRLTERSHLMCMECLKACRYGFSNRGRV